MTKDEIKNKLDEYGIEHKEDMKKDELLKLLKDHEASKGEETVPEENPSNESEIEKKQYVVIHDFKDLKDNNTIYIKGDIYPRRADTEVSEERIEELTSKNNKIGKPLIKEQA